MLPKFFPIESLLHTNDFLGMLDIRAVILAASPLIIPRRKCVKAVRPVVDCAFVNPVTHSSIAVEIHHRAHGAIDRELFPIGTKASNLGVLVREVSSLEQRIIREADTGDNMRSAEGDLLGLAKEFVDIAVKDEFSYFTDGNEVLGPNLSGVQNIKLEVVLVALGNALDAEFPLWI